MAELSPRRYSHGVQRNVVSWLRVVALVEGVSFLVLLGIAMPLKYAAGMPEPVKVVGWIHGVLFVALVLLLAAAMSLARLPIPKAALVFGASLVPFGPFLIDRRLREYQPDRG